MVMKTSYILPLLILLFCSFQEKQETVHIRMQFVNRHQKTIGAKVYFMNGKEVIQMHKTDGFFEFDTPKKDYELIIVRCDSIRYILKAYHNKRTIMILNDDCNHPNNRIEKINPETLNI